MMTSFFPEGYVFSKGKSSTVTWLTVSLHRYLADGMGEDDEEEGGVDDEGEGGNRVRMEGKEGITHQWM
jgi:hypothetical protein